LNSKDDRKVERIYNDLPNDELKVRTSLTSNVQFPFFVTAFGPQLEPGLVIRWQRFGLSQQACDICVGQYYCHFLSIWLAVSLIHQHFGQSDSIR
jgi:hypothetical protein